MGPCNEATPPHRVPSALKTRTQNIDGLLAETARADWELLERQPGGRNPSKKHGEDKSRRIQPNNKEPIAERAAEAPIPAAATLDTTFSQRNKRERDSTEDLSHEEADLDERVARCKRLRTSGSNADEVRGSSEHELRQKIS